MQRHYGLDWLRIGAFAILIVYHIGMVFVPWPFHVKLAHEDWVAVPMMISNPWRLSLLFVVSGYASRALFARSTGSGWRGAGRFAGNRSLRLLIPLLFGVIVVIPPQPWVELATQHGYRHGFAHFLASDYFGFRKLAGIDLPTWQHLWFVVYLWVYTLALALAAAAMPGGVRRIAQRAFNALFGGIGALLIPMAWLIAVSALFFPGARETHALLGDRVAHATYLPMFLFGFALARSERTIATFARWWWVTALLAIASYAVVAMLEITYPGGAPRPWGTVFSLMRGVEGWMAIAALIGVAENFWNRDHRWRPMLTEAVFPFYIIHQTVIVVVAYWLIPLRLPGGVDFAILVAATVAGCWLFYLAGRAVPLLRPLIGLRRRAPSVSPRVARS